MDTFKDPYAKAVKDKQKKEQEERRQRLKDIENEIQTAEVLEDDDRVEELKAQLAQLEVKQVTYEEKLTDALDAQTKKIIVAFFLLAVPLLLAALGISMWATINSEPPEFVDGTALLDRSVSSVLGGRNSWENFTATCCVIPSITAMTGFNLTERWVCSNMTYLPPSYLPSPRGNASAAGEWLAEMTSAATSPLTVSRNRQAVVLYDGTVIRQFSSAVFNDPFGKCNVTVGGDVYFNCPETVVDSGKADKYTLSVLW